MKATRMQLVFRRWARAAGAVLVCTVLAGAALTAPGQSNEWLAPGLRPLFSRLQAMSHGVHSDAEWKDLVADVEGQMEAARRGGDVEQMIDAAVILSQIHSDMRGDHVRALDVLRQARSEAAAANPAGMYKLYVRLAEVHAIRGDEAAIGSLIAEFRGSRFYNPRPFDTSGGERPGVAVRIPRPQAGGDPSLTVSTMKKYARQARLAPGKPFPTVPTEGRDPNRTLLDPSHTKLLLVDFWLPGWTVWERDLPTLARLYRDYRDAGLVVVGVPLTAVGPADMERLSAAGMTWPQVRLDRTDLRRFEVIGEVTNFLVDQRGVILARNLRGHPLEAAIDAALRP